MGLNKELFGSASVGDLEIKTKMKIVGEGERAFYTIIFFFLQSTTKLLSKWATTP